MVYELPETDVTYVEQYVTSAPQDSLPIGTRLEDNCNELHLPCISKSSLHARAKRRVELLEDPDQGCVCVTVDMLQIVLKKSDHARSWEGPG